MTSSASRGRWLAPEPRSRSHGRSPRAEGSGSSSRGWRARRAPRARGWTTCGHCPSLGRHDSERRIGPPERWLDRRGRRAVRRRGHHVRANRRGRLAVSRSCLDTSAYSLFRPRIALDVVELALVREGPDDQLVVARLGAPSAEPADRHIDARHRERDRPDSRRKHGHEGPREAAKHGGGGPRATVGGQVRSMASDLACFGIAIGVLGVLAWIAKPLWAPPEIGQGPSEMVDLVAGARRVTHRPVSCAASDAEVGPNVRPIEVLSTSATSISPPLRMWRCSVCATCSGSPSRSAATMSAWLAQAAG